MVSKTSVTSAETPPNAPIATVMQRVATYIPGIAVCVAAAAVAYGVSVMVPGLSAMLVAILLGILVTNIAPLPAITQPGVTFSAKKLLRIGIVLLGLQLVLGDIIALGAPLLIVVVAIVGVRQRRVSRAAGTEATGAKLPPIVPFFVIGFLAMVLLRSFVPLPDAVITAGGAIQTALLAAAMFALGLGVQVRKLIKVGLRPFVLAALSTIIVAATAFAGVMLFG